MSVGHCDSRAKSVTRVCPVLAQSTQNPENLLIFAAGNDGDEPESQRECTIGSPAIGKNVLAIGSTSSGETRLTTTTPDGEDSSKFNGGADIDTISSFSSYGPTRDQRIKPELVAPGDMVRAWSPYRSMSLMCWFKPEMWAERLGCCRFRRIAAELRRFVVLRREFRHNVQCIRWRIKS